MSSPRRAALALTTAVLLANAAVVPAVAAPSSKGSGSTCKRGCADTTAPAVAIATPAANATVAGTVTVSGSASDAGGVAKVEFMIDANGWQATSGTTSWSRTVDTTTLSEGSHVFAARAVDAAGNEKLTSIAVTVKNGPAADTTAPSVDIASPGPSATVEGTIMTTGTAVDDGTVSKIEVRVDSGAWQLASGTSSWSNAIDTRTLSNGTHTIASRATDLAGNAGTDTVTVSVSNAPPPDTTAPSVSISAPSAGATVSGSVSASGSASDSVGVASVEVKVDAGSWQTASGTTSWSRSIDTTTLSDGSHTVTVRATDAAGNAGTATRSVTVANTAPSTPGTWTSPEGTTIEIASDVTGWTHAEIHRMLVENGLDATVGRTLTVKVQTRYASSVTSGASESGGRYDSFSATMYLKATANTGFTLTPDATLSHEFGHVWTLYHLYMSQHGDWSRYLTARGLDGDPRLESTYGWAKTEIVADDYRLLFGSPAAIAQRPHHLNADLPDPRDVPGLRTFFTDVWSVGVAG